MIMALAVWPLLALMTAAQAFTADRAGGTDAFLLQRPVPRPRVWQARAGAALATTLVIVAVQLAVWWASVRLVGNPAGFDESATLARLLVQGGLGATIALLAGTAAAGFVRLLTVSRPIFQLFFFPSSPDVEYNGHTGSLLRPSARREAARPRLPGLAA